MVTDDYRTKGKRSLPHLASRLRHLLEFFREDLRALDLTTDVMVRYQAHRQAQGAAGGTINVELAALARGLSLARLYGRLTHAPKIPYLVVRNARRGFFERPELEAIAGAAPPAAGGPLPDTYRALVWSCYLSGWRPKAELLTRAWLHVDFASGWLRLEQGETKNGDGREIPLTGELRAVLEWQRDRCDALQRTIGRVIPWVFFKGDGSRLVSYFKPWEKARRAAGMPQKLLYDCRRTRVRNFERAGVPRSAGMAWVGHRTEQMYRRYAIADRALLEDAAAKADAFEQNRAGRSIVLPMHKGIDNGRGRA
jgi:integrase